MTERTVTHATFVVDRTIKHPPERVFNAFANDEAKQKWFGGSPDNWAQLHRVMDFRPGGVEESKGEWKSGMISHFVCRYHEIVPNERIVYTYDMYVDGVRLSVSLDTIELTPVPGGTRLLITEMGAYLDGHADGAASREHGTNALIDALVASLD